MWLWKINQVYFIIIINHGQRRPTVCTVGKESGLLWEVRVEPGVKGWVG